MFKNAILFLFISCLLTLPAAGDIIEKCGNIYPPGETWVSGNTYIVTCSVRILDGATVTIQPGVEVLFDAGIGMRVNGTLVAQGTPVSPIRFSANTAEPTYDYWAYLWFEDTSEDAVLDQGNWVSGCVLDNCVVEYAGSATASVWGAVRIESCSPFISNSYIRYNNNIGIWVDDGAPPIHDNLVEYNDIRGIYYQNLSTVDLVGNTIQYNNIGGNGRDGGGVYVSDSFGNIEGNQFLYNEARDGAGIAILPATGGSYTFTTNTFNENIASSYGGGIYIYQSNGGNLNFNFSGNIISNNQASLSGGGAYCRLISSANSIVSYSGDSITYNHAGGSGGGVYEYPSYSDNYEFSMDHCDLIGNTCDGWGGGVCYQASWGNYTGTPAAYTNCIVRDNSSSGPGGGIAHFQGYNSSGGVSTENCTFSGNETTGDNGGGLYNACNSNSNLDLSVTNCTIINNRGPQKGGGVYLDNAPDGGSVNFSNNVISENTLTSAVDVYGCGLCIDFLPGAANTTIKENSFIRNTGTSPTANYWGTAVYNNDCDEGNINFCTVAENAQGHETAGTVVAIYLDNPDAYDPLPMQYNNIVDNGNEDDYWLWNNCSVVTNNVDATLNWWGSVNYPEIDTHIWDYFDDASLSIVDIYPGEPELIQCIFIDPDTFCAPPQPPTSLSYTAGYYTMDLSWDPVDVGNLCGYRIYYDTDGTGVPYEGTGLNEGDSGAIEVDELTTLVTLSGLQPNTCYVFAVTALSSGPDYDCLTTGDNMESWFSNEVSWPVGCQGSVSCQLTCNPAVGTLPFATQMIVDMINVTDYNRRVAAHIDVVVAGGSYYANWRAGFTNLSPLETYTTTWSQNLPATGAMIGDSVFTMNAQDVTPAPYNQPPFPPDGWTDLSNCTVTGVAP